MTGAEIGYIAVEGPIGVGKTTLAKRLARSFGCELLLETPEENPFLPRFYENPRNWALSTQLFFLLQRARQTQLLRQEDMFNPVWVADFLVEKDRMFAELTLDPDELNLYEQVHAHVIEDVRQPDLVIYLQAPVSVLRERISRRGVTYEQFMDRSYLRRLVEAYTRLFHNYDAAPLLIVNASEIDLADSEDDYNLLFERLKTLQKGRHYLNPLAL